MKLSARNILHGTVKHIETGPVNSTISIDVGGGTLIAAMITTDSVKRLGLEVGKTAHAIVKASDVIVAVD